METAHRIRFQKPDLPSLSQVYTVVDMHFHTHYTDGMASVRKIAERAHNLGIGIAITDHNDIRGAVEINRYRNILTIPGIEITSREGTHLLVYFYEIRELKQFYQQSVLPYIGSDIMSSTQLGLESLIHRAKQFKCLIIFPHPHCAAYTGVCNLNFKPETLSRLLEIVDGVEVINSENVKKWNLKSAILGFNLDKAITGGSDGHSLYQMGRAVSYAKCKRNRKAFLDDIKQKKNKVIGKEIHLLGKVGSNSLKLKNNLRNYPNIMEKNIRYSYTIINSKSKTIKDNFKRRVNSRFRGL